MGSRVRLYIDRAENELKTAQILSRVSEEEDLKEEFEVDSDTTFYSSVISHSYFSIFFASKAILKSKGITTESPNVHRKTFKKFKEEFVDSGVLDVELLKIYEELVVKADELLQIFKEEKWKRGQFTYKTLSQANKEPAENSVENAKKFLKNIRKVLNSA
ncbi:MAG: HEPN domain-containing protein [Candidatus Nanohaloarchaea archaeon]|nr:HEPN domain-containing protein [Candidatus Nanohaloarchaea archaeon]